RPLVASLAETLSFYRAFSKHPTILTGKILDNNELEIMLSEGLGQYIDAYTKNQNIFVSEVIVIDAMYSDPLLLLKGLRLTFQESFVAFKCFRIRSFNSGPY
ncbi:hypothetical protein ACUOA8_41255, partial [Escherichia sp. SS-MK2]